MELIEISNHITHELIKEDEIIASKGNFIEANTKKVTLDHLKEECIIPVYSDNETSISHAQFIETAMEVTNGLYTKHKVLYPDIRVSHIIKGRVPSAIGKPVKDLRPDEKTIYYQRCAFMIEIPDYYEIVNGNKVCLTIGGVRALNQENLYSRRNLEKFKIFIGFKNTVCTNLCISTDGFKSDVRVSALTELKQKMTELFNQFDSNKFLGNMERMSKFQLNESEFAHLVGKMRMYQHLNKEEKADLNKLTISDHQIGTMVKNYFEDKNFAKDNDGIINLWQLYNLMTEANKSSYIDSNLDRNVNAFDFVNELTNSLQSNSENWFLKSY